MEWNDKYCIGVEHIDAQHKGLFTAINRVLRILEEKDAERSRRACIEAIKYLKNYTLQHFSDEEAYQREIAYSGYARHKAQHDDFIRAIAIKEAVMEADNYSRDSVQSLMDLLISWLVGHIMNSDQAITHG